jgi:pyruvate dehydrogenase E1 component
LRAFFEYDRRHVVVATLAALARQGDVPASTVTAAIGRYAIDATAGAPWTR